MKITILAVGKLKEDYLREAAAFFSQQLSRHCFFEIIELPDEKNGDNPSPAAEETIKKIEGTKILKRIKPSHFVAALAIEGEPLSTPGLRAKLKTWQHHGKEDFVFVIGGSLGLSQEVLKRADYKISFSPMTFPHQLMRIMLMEQIYTVLKGSAQ